MPVKKRGKRSLRRKPGRPKVLDVDLASILSVDHACNGCRPGEPCCCSSYEVCVTLAELERIIPVLPEVVRLCPHLDTIDGYDNIFDEVEPGLFAIDTDEDGLCLFAFRTRGKVRCSLHTAGATLGLAPEMVKPKACLLWPLNFSEGKEVLSLVDDALHFRCNTSRRGRSQRFSPAFLEAVNAVYGRGTGERLERQAARGARRVEVSCRR